MRPHQALVPRRALAPRLKRVSAAARRAGLPLAHPARELAPEQAPTPAWALELPPGARARRLALVRALAQAPALVQAPVRELEPEPLGPALARAPALGRPVVRALVVPSNHRPYLPANGSLTGISIGRGSAKCWPGLRPIVFLDRK